MVLAFPRDHMSGNPLIRKSNFVFAFLPVRSFGLRFVVQADFLLAASREELLKENEWNRWLRDSLVSTFALGLSPHGSIGIIDTQVSELCRRFRKFKEGEDPTSLEGLNSKDVMYDSTSNSPL